MCSVVWTDALALCGVDYLVVGPRVLATLKESQTLQVSFTCASPAHYFLSYFKLAQLIAPRGAPTPLR